MIPEKSKVYICGPMTGKTLFNHPLLLGWAALLEREFKCTVLNPARHPIGLTYDEYIKRGLEDVFQADVIVALPGALDSPGAMGELMLGFKEHKDVINHTAIEKHLDKKWGNDEVIQI